MSPNRRAIVPLPADCDPRHIFFVIGHGTEDLAESAREPPEAARVPPGATLVTASHCGLPVYTKLQVARLFARAGECALRGHYAEFDYYPADAEMPRLNNTLVLEHVAALPAPAASSPRGAAGAPHRLVLAAEISVAKSGVYAVYGMPTFSAEPLAEHADAPDVAALAAAAGAPPGLRAERNDYELAVQPHRARLRWTLALSSPEPIGPALVAAVEARLRAIVAAMCREAQVGSLLRAAHALRFRNVTAPDGTIRVTPVFLSRTRAPIARILAAIQRARARLGSSPSGASGAATPTLVYYLGCRSFADADYEKYTKKYEDAFSVAFGYALPRYRAFFVKRRAEINALLAPWITVADLFRYDAARDEAARDADGSPRSPQSRAAYETFLAFYDAILSDIATRAAPILSSLLARLADAHPDDATLARHRDLLAAEETQEFHAKLKTAEALRRALAAAALTAEGDIKTSRVGGSSRTSARAARAPARRRAAA